MTGSDQHPKSKFLEVPPWLVGLRALFLTWIAPTLLEVMEVAMVAIVFLLACYIAWWLVFGASGDPGRDRVIALLKLASDDWKALLLLGIPLFYRAVRAFIERVERFYGVEAPLAKPTSRAREQVENPPTTPDR